MLQFVLRNLKSNFNLYFEDAIELIQQLYDGLLRFTPFKKYIRYLSNQKGIFPLVGFLNSDKKSKLEDILNIQIENIEYFEQALIHRSYLQVLKNDCVLSNERLEFLGDSILGMVVAEYLFSLHSHVPEGELTKMRSWLVNSDSLALTAKKLGIQEFIMLSYSAEKSLDQGSDSIMADTLEALIGAIYLDSGLIAAKSFIIDSIISIEMNSSIMEDRNYKSILLEGVQSKGYSSPVYKMVEEAGPDHDKLFTIGVFINDELAAIGSGKNKKQAAQAAAKKVLDGKKYF